MVLIINLSTSTAITIMCFRWEDLQLWKRSVLNLVSIRNVSQSLISDVYKILLDEDIYAHSLLQTIGTPICFCSATASYPRALSVRMLETVVYFDFTKVLSQHPWCSSFNLICFYFFSGILLFANTYFLFVVSIVFSDMHPFTNC